MAKDYRNQIFDLFEERIKELYPELPQSKRRSLASALASTALVVHLEHSKGFAEMHSELSLKYEQNRKQFADHITYIESRAKIFIDHMVTNKFVEINWDAVARKNKMNYKTKLVQHIVEFMNHLNEQVIDYYRKVFTFETSTTQQSGETDTVKAPIVDKFNPDFTQSSLF